MNRQEQQIIDAAIRELNQKTRPCYILRQEPGQKMEIYVWEAPIVRAPRKTFFE